ncbi:MAG: hypothetical protein BWY75_00342 [bacterium ADurb.Bin425]|nr:MAG: hypothetical protein BWY75_00342 [bacterium ADurb.Bin425]
MLVISSSLRHSDKTDAEPIAIDSADNRFRRRHELDFTGETFITHDMLFKIVGSTAGRFPPKNSYRLLLGTFDQLIPSAYLATVYLTQVIETNFINIVLWIDDNSYSVPRHHMSTQMNLPGMS